ncbi:MAG: prepilin-type N-terminal cleavage/methylation domain-containing protein [bacterium]
MRKQNNAGFNLIELLIALALVAFIIPTIFTIYNSSHKCYVMQESITNMHQNARATMELMTRELRDSFICHIADANTLTFYMDNPNTVVGISSGDNTVRTLNDETQNWDPNMWKNTLVAITRGTGANQIKTVLKNSSTQLITSSATDPNWSPIPDETSIYHLDVVQKEFSWAGSSNIIYYDDGAHSGAESFTDNITNLTFSMDPTTGKIEIQLTARTERKDPKNDQYHTYNLKSTVKTRNL